MIKGNLNDQTRGIQLNKEKTIDELMYQEFTRSAKIGFGMADLDGITKYVNPALSKMIEMTPEAILGKPFIPVYPEEIQQKFKVEIFPELLKNGSWQGELYIITKNGKRIITKEHYTLLTDPETEKQYISAIIHDVTIEKEQQERDIELANLKEQFGFIQAMDDALVVIDMNGNHKLVNPAFLDLIQYDEKDVLETNAMELIQSIFIKEDLPKVMSNFKKVMEGKEAPVFQLHIKRKDNKKVIVSVKASIQRDESGKPLKVIASFRDITELLEAQDSERKLQQKFSQFIDFLSIPLCNVDNDTGDILFINRKFQEVFGYTIEDIPNLKQWWEKAYPASSYRKIVLEKWENAVAKSIKNNTEIKSEEYMVQCKNGDVRFIVIGGVVLDNEFMAIFLDVTEKKNTERERGKLLHQLNERLKEMSTLFVIEKIESDQTLSMKVKLKKIVDKIPFGCQFPEDIGAIIKLDEMEYKTDNYRSSGNFLEAEIVVNNVQRGYVRVAFITEVDSMNGSCFLPEEENLINSIAYKINKMIESKIAHEKLVSSEEKYRSFVQKFHGIAFRSKLNWTPVYFHGAVEEITGYSEDDFIKGNPRWDQIVNKEDLEKILASSDQEKIKSSGFFTEREYRIITKNGSVKWVHDYLQTVYNDIEGENILQGAIYDITQTIEYEEQLKQHKDHTKIINKILRHDLTNNLAAVSSHLRIYGKSKDERDLTGIKNYVDKSLKLIGQMRELENFIDKNRNLKIVKLEEIIQQLREKYNKTKFTVSGKADILADEAINSIFDNIIGNAVKHGKTDRIDISIKKIDKLCEVKVSDFGSGIDDKVKASIFDENFVSGDSGGSGLGLYIVKSTMGRYGGRISVEDNDPNGTTFVLWFRKI